MQTPPRSPWPKNRSKTCDAQRIGSPTPLAKPPATMTTRVRATTKQREYQTTRKKANPDGVTNKAITAHQPGLAQLANAADAVPRATECTPGTNARREISYASYAEKRASTGVYAEATKDNRTLPADTTIHDVSHITRHHPRTHLSHPTQSHKK